MKKSYIIIGIIVIVITVLLVLFIRKKKENVNKVDINNIISFHLSYSNGYMMNANIIYDYYYDKKLDKYMVSVKPHLVADEDKVLVEASSDFGDKIKDILIKYNVSTWNGFSEADKNVLDGDDFSLSIRMEDEQNISANGYMRWPNNYRNVRDEFDNLFMKIYNDEKM